MPKLYTVKWNDDEDLAYHARLTDSELEQLQKRMTAASEIETFSIMPLEPTVNSFEQLIDTLEDYGV